MPVEALRFVPLAPLSKFAAHKQKFLSRVRPHVAVQRAEVGKFLFLRAGHLIQQSALHVYNFIVRERQDKVFTPGVEQTKRQRVVITSTKQWIGLKILKRVVHPSHVPFEIESQSACVNRMTNLGPGGRFLGNHHRAGTLRGASSHSTPATTESHPGFRGRQTG